MMIINLLGLALIALIIWWFWIYQPKNESLEAVQHQPIKVANGVYQPAFVTVPANQEATLSFIRTDESPCAETLVFPELNISETLPLNHVIEIKLPALTPGSYTFHCQMQMYRGQIRVEGES
ncbi:cupredoxin domain-containing protein [Litoribrevibacter albus]|uniref:EfeO-type cupredoxin-like domain-containing protein n=1 Tax=Litoribrevibacter albus TaxID=1473156 RepID=A0AA37S8R7_9GAMM|nr:cupredoxin domain-containing protein [Litoribrevibacter albus]GLQ30258.1 hypothetical protein GCM10007876_07360 [Litoribrevibacter albus]